jgi:transcriptional regulator with XRE-family HTH domain
MDDEKARRAKRFRERVAAKGLTLAELGRRAGLTRNILWGLSQGRTPKADIAKRIAAILGPDA